MMSDVVDYSALGSNQIRLVHLQPQSCSDDILSCYLEIHSRAACPQYVALSYAWARDGQTASIILNGKKCRVSETIEQALRELCRRDNTFPIWVDQLCINQTDVEEKTGQVLQMRHTYSNANSCVAWLGPAFHDSDILFTYLHHVGNENMNRNWAGLALLHDDEVHLQRVARAWDLLCQRPYWTRLWILQEVSLASDLSFSCGSSSIPFEILKAAWGSLLAVQREQVEQPSESKESLVKCLKTVFSPLSGSFMDSVITRRVRYRATSGDLDDLFSVTATCLCLEKDENYPLASNPRDRIFALLYLAEDYHEFEHILDYSKSCSEVYYEVALVQLKQGRVDLLSYCQFPRTMPDLPTWVPDWNMRVRFPSTWSTNCNKVYASGYTASKQDLSEIRHGQLKIKGFTVDTITKYGKVWKPDWLVPLDRDAALAFIDDILQLCNQSTRTRAGEELLEAIRVACCDGARYGAEDISDGLIVNYISEFFWAYERLKTTELPGKDDETGKPDDSDWFVEALHFLLPRRPFLTRSGFVGLGPAHMEQGDEVYIFFGGHVPYIVRQQENNKYSLVGEAFVHGIMYGEALRTDVEESTLVLI
jgi:hypothetical protein